MPPAYHPPASARRHVATAWFFYFCWVICACAYRRGLDEATAIQYITGALIIIFQILSILVTSMAGYRKRDIKIHKSLYFFLTCLLIIPAISQIINLVDPIYFLKAYLRYVIVVFGAVSTVNIIKRTGDFHAIFLPVYIGSIIAAAAAYYNVAYVRQLDIMSSRYHILAPTTIYMACFLLPFFLRIKAKISLENIAFIVAVSAIIISQTRNSMGALLVALMLHIALCIVYGPRMRASWMIVSLGIAVFFFALFSFVAESDLIAGWYGRIFAAEEYGLDPTSATRVAEYTGQINAVTSNAVSLLFGMGLGSPFDWAYTSDLNSIIQAGIVPGDVGTGDTEFGHSLYVYSFYSGGLLGGWVLPVLLLTATYRAFSSFRQHYANPKVRNFYQGLFLTGIGVTISGFAAHVIGDYGIAAIFSIFISLCFVQYTPLVPAPALSRQQRVPRR